ncbi:hypothetical protein ABGB08_38135 [Acrocarpospora sp. B8E8]
MNLASTSDTIRSQRRAVSVTSPSRAGTAPSGISRKASPPSSSQ